MSPLADLLHRFRKDERGVFLVVFAVLGLVLIATSGAVVEGLDLSALDIGPEIAPGVPAVKAAGRPIWLSLKSGNFGADDFFTKTWRLLR